MLTKPNNPFAKNFNDLLMGLNINPIPLEFSQSLTTGEWLSYLTNIIKTQVENNDKYTEKLYNDFLEEFKKLENDLQDKMSVDNFVEKYKNVITEICRDYAMTVLGDCISYVTFGLDDEGYFYADVPDNLDELHFCTDMTKENFGKLVVEY